ncbi:MAG: hypothetical protein J6T70_03770 [Bacteroidales bacterium]|nr:hypothetical protein [Bacteroidales bacterium]
MRKFALAFVFMLSALCLNAQDYEEYLSFGENADDQDTDFLGFCLLPGSNLLERFVEIHINPDGTLKYTYLTMDGFVNRAAGRERSAANSKGADYFANFGIKNPGIVGDLWKLRYTEYPYATQDKPEQGWSTNDSIPVLPSEAQMAILKKYGIFKISDYCYGLMAFMLLHDMEDPAWIEKYKNASYQGGAVPQNNNNIKFDVIGNENRSNNNDEENTFVD